MTGACLLTRREIFDQAGGLNETLAVSFNDVDLCLRIFERGYRTSAARNSTVPGTGLGLHFARCIAQAHGGDIEVISVPGQGSCFRVSLPLKTPPGAPAALNTEVHERTIN